MKRFLIPIGALLLVLLITTSVDPGVLGRITPGPDKDEPAGDLVSAPGSARLRPADLDDLDKGPIRIDMARGEREGVQIVLPQAQRGRLRIEGPILSRDTAPPSAGGTVVTNAVTVYHQQEIEVDEASPGGDTGGYYDGLIPVSGKRIDVARGGPVALWIDVKMSRDASVGEWGGRLTLSGPALGGAPARSVDIVVNVHAAQLPERPLLKTSIGLDASQVERFEKIPRADPKFRAAYDSYMQALVDARLSTADYDTTPPDVVNGAYLATPDGKRLTRVANQSAAIRIPFYATFPFEDPLGADRARAVAYLRSMAALYAGQGWLSRAYVYVVDEPTDSDVERVADFRRIMEEADPRLRLLLTIDPRPEFDDAADIWVANISDRFDPADVTAARKQGREYWWYPSISTHPPYPTLFIDDTRPSPRAMGWIAFRYDVQGLLYWTATHWHDVDNPWRDAATYEIDGAVGNGDGSLLYPGKPRGVAGPLPSIRLLQLRDGVEDYELLTLLARTDPKRADELAKRLASSARDFETDASKIGLIRADLLEAVQG